MKHYIISGILLILSFRAVSQVFQPYENQVLYSWAFPYESYQFGGMQFRLKTPNNFDSLGVEKYPLILFLHGAGEGGDSNEKQLIHGGRNTLDAITSGEFPGLALYPQATGSKWLAIQINQAKAIVDQLILNYNVDPNRIYVHGLSGGADGTWRFAYAYPELVAAIHPMSGVPGFGEAVGVTRFIPTWLAQGGKDGNPSPFDGNSRVEKMRTDGANIRYSYQPNTGHGTWNTQYNKPDFFTWFLDKSKTDITVEYGQSSFCEGETININLGITAGFNNYEWAKNNTTNIISSGAGVNRINVTVPGLYYVRFRRGTEWTEWSDPVDVNFNLAAAAVVSTETGNQSLNLPALSGQQSVEISGPQDIAFYQWINNAFPINGATGASYIVNEAGSYSLSVRPEQETGYDPDGMTPSEFRAAPQPCFSDPSDPVIITTENDLNVPAKPTNFAANVLNDNSVTINWDDIANNELAFELYRSTQSGSQYNLVKRILSNTSPNPQLYIDQPVEANTTYYYRMRAVNNSGGSVYTEEVSTTTALDVEPPTAPLLSLAGTSSNSISLSWTTSSDNVGVVNYEVYRDNNLIATVTGTSYVNVSLPSNQIYSYTVRANDLSGNISVPSNQITARTINSGLTYSYYHHNNLSVVSQIETNGTLIRTGNINNFDITIRDQNERFAFVFEGFIFIPEAGTYTFYTSSDDGSRLFINGNSVVNNDGPHGCNERNGQVTLAAGFAQIRVPFFENGGGECLQVRWQGPGIAKQLIPDEVLFEDEFVPANAPLAPTTLSVIGSSNDQIDLNWQDNSNDENSFEIYRSLALNSGYEVVQVVDANVTEWSDTGLSGSTTYYYKLKAINFNGSSEFVGPASTATLVNPPTPAAPTDLLLSVVNVKDVELSWTDNANNELGFEIYRSTANIASTFTLIHTTNENITNYVDTQTSGNSQYFYRVRAKGVESFSAYSAILNINTPNTAPAIEPIINRSVKFGTTLNLHVAVDDADGDPLTFTFDPVLPPFISFADNGYGQGEFTISPVLANEGVYTIDFSVTDGSGGTDSESFVITVSDNDNPTISSIANLEMNEGFTEYIYVSVTDETLPTVTLQASNLPAFITFTDDGSGNGTFEIAPQIGDAGNYNNIKVIASDGEGGFSESTFNVTVNAVKRNYSVQVNFGPTAAPAPWNNIAGKGNSFFSLISNDGISQDINFDIFNQFYTEGHTTTLTSDDYPNEVTQSFLWKNSGDAIFTLENLNPGLSYDITFLVAVGSEFTTKTIGSNTRFTINNVLKTASPNNGLVNTVKFVELRPDAFGQIRITPNGNQYILNAMVVDVYYDDGLVPIAPSNLSLTATSSSEVEVSWQDNSNNEQRFEVYRSNVSETGPFQLVQSTLLNENTYTDMNLESSTLYYYKVRSVNANGIGETAVELVTTLNSAPTITPIADIILKTGESLSIPVDAIDNEGDPITLSGANLPAFAQLIDNGDGTGQVSITTGNDDIGFYEGIVITAEDNFGNNSSISFLISVTDASFDNAVYINFGSGSDAVTPWNNINTLPTLGGVVNGFSNSNGDPSVFGIRVGSNWTSVDNTGLPASYSSSFPYDQQVLEGAWKSDSVEWNEGTQNPSLEIIGLDENAIYNIALIVATNRWKKSLADYNFQGTSKRINPLSNEENTYYFNSISPNALGKIDLVISGTELSEYIYLNAIIVKEVDVTNAVPLAPSKLKAAGESRNTIDLKWVDNSFNETGFEIYSSDEIGKVFSLLAAVGPNTEMYSHTGLSTDDHFIYKVRAISGSVASAFSSEAAAITLHHQLLININTNQASDLPAPSPWNNTNRIPEPGGITFGALNDENNVASPEELRLEQFGTGGANIGGFVTGDDSGVYPDNAIQAYYFAETNDIPVIFKLNNLDQDFNYNFTFFASEGLNLNPVTFATAISEFKIGNETKILLADYNSSETVSIENVSPDTENAINFELTSSAALNSRFGFINAFVVDVHTPIDVAFDNINPSSPQNLQAVDITDTNLELIWDVATDNVRLKEYEVFMNGNLLNTIAGTSLIVENLTPDFEYIFSVRAVDRNNNKSSFFNELIINTALPIGDFTVYYSLSGVADLNVLTTWNTAQDGSGSTPSTFSGDNQSFHLTRNATIASTFTLSGLASKLIVIDNVELILNAGFIGIVEARQNAIINVNVNNSPIFNKLDPSSTVVFNGTDNNIPSAVYGNLSLENASSTKQFSLGNVTIEGTLNMVDGIALNGMDPNGTSIVAKGPVSFHGIGAATPDNQTISLVMAGTGEQQIQTFNNDINLFAIEVRSGANVIFDTGDPGRKINIGNASGGGITIEEGASLHIGNHDLIVNGKGTINSENQLGRIKSNKGNLEIHSTSTLTSHLYFEPGIDTLNLLLADMVNLGKVEINSPLHIATELQIIDGIVDARGNLTMVSSAEGTAYISEIQNRGEIQGTIKAQRFVTPPPNRLYRYFGSMVKNAEVAAWQAHIAITGPFSGSSTGPGLGSSPSVYYYDENTAANWVAYPITDSQELMEAGKGFTVFTRDLNNPLTLELTGEPVQGDFVFDLVAAGTGDALANDGIGDGWNLIANPYQSPIQWGTTGWSSIDLSPILSIWDSDYPGGGKYFYAGGGVSDPSFTGEVASGQGFWVQALAANPQLTISESAKVKTTDAVYFRNTVLDNVQFTIRLSKDGLEDKAFIRYSENGSELYDGAVHGRKRANAIFNVSTASADGVDLAINNLSSNFCRDSIAIVTSNLTVGAYALTFEKLETFRHNERFTLVDHFTQAEVNISNATNYTFEVSDATGPSGIDRFSLIIEKPELVLDKVLIASQSVVCESEGLPFVTLQNAQKGVLYTVLVNNTETSIEVTGQGADLAIDLTGTDFVFGSNDIKLKAAFVGCDEMLLSSALIINYISLPTTVSSADYISCLNKSALIEVPATSDGLSFKWYADEFAEEPIFESANNTFETPELTASTSFYYIAVNSNGCESRERGVVNVIVKELDLDKVLSTSSSAICESEDLPFITVQNAQEDVLYTVVVNDIETTMEAVGQGADLVIDLANTPFVYGNNVISLKVAQLGCDKVMLNNSISIDYSSLPTTNNSESYSICINERAFIEVDPTESGLIFRWYIDESAEDPILESLNNLFETPELTASTTYYYTVINSNGCESIRRQAVNVIVKELEQPVITFENGVLTSNSQSDNQWYFNDNLIVGATDATLVVDKQGIYTVRASNGICEVFSEEFEYFVISANTNSEDFNLSIYPNPAHKYFNIVFNQVLNENVDLKIIDLTGREVYRSSMSKGTNQQSININNLATGTYIVQMIYNREQYQKRLIVH